MADQSMDTMDNKEVFDDFSDKLSLESTSVNSLQISSDSEDNSEDYKRKAQQKHVCIEGKVSYELECRQTVPQEVYEYECLKELILDYNDLSELTEELSSKLTQLKVLSIMGNKLIALPTNIHLLEQLEQLFVDENRLYELPEQLCRLSRLRRLHCQGNRLTRLPQHFNALKQLKYLKLNENQLKGLPEMFGLLTELSELDLSYNAIELLPQTIGSLESLRVLNISHNKLKELPISFGQMSNIESLELSSNDLEVLPLTFCSAKRLKRLFADNNTIGGRLPDWFAEMEELEELCLKYNRLRESPFPDRFGDVCHKLVKLDISGNLIESLPESFANIKSLVFVDTGSVLFEPERRKELRNGNNIRHLPQNFGFDYHLMKELRLDENDIEELPKCFGEGMPALEVLDLYCNMIEELPDSFCKLNSLRIFCIGMNCLQKLPTNFGELIALEELRAEINELRYLPKTFDNLVNLRVLDLYKNSFPAFPSILRNMENIKSLQVGLEVTNMFIRIDAKDKYKLERLQRAVDFGIPKRTKITNFFKLNNNFHSFENNSQLSEESPKSSQTESTSHSTITSGYSSLDLIEDNTNCLNQSWDYEDFDPERPYRHEPLIYPSSQRIQTPVEKYFNYIPLKDLPKRLKPSKKIKLTPVEGQFDSD